MPSNRAAQIAAEALMRGAVVVSRRNGREDLVQKFQAIAGDKGPECWARARQAVSEAVWDKSFGKFEVEVATNSAEDMLDEDLDPAWEARTLIDRLAQHLLWQVGEKDETEEGDEEVRD